MPKLILARHGVTPYNEAGIWTGLTDIDMSGNGYREVGESAAIVANYAIGVALCSKLARARNTARVILGQQSNKNIPLLETSALNEKDYGVFTGRNKDEVKTEVGEDIYGLIRRSWDYRMEEGESLQDVHARIVPVHRGIVVPVLESGRTVLVSSHNNTLRAYIKDIEGVADEAVSTIELGTAEVRIYDFDAGNFSLEAKHAIGDVH